MRTLGVMPGLGDTAVVAEVSALRCEVTAVRFGLVTARCNGALELYTARDRVVIVPRAMEERVDDAMQSSSSTERVPRGVVIAELVRATGDSLEAQLGVGERASVGDRVRITSREPTVSRMAPARVGGLTEITVRIGGVIPLRVPALITTVEAQLAYRFLGPGVLGVGIDPAVLALQFVSSPLGEQANVMRGAFVARAWGGVDTRLFAAGALIGSASVFSPRAVAFEHGLAFGVWARVGARDGLHGRVELALGAMPTSVQIASASLALESPLRWFTLALRAQWTGGVLLAGMGLKLPVRGNGDHGTVWLEPFGGVTILDEIPGSTTARELGVWLGLGVDVRP